MYAPHRLRRATQRAASTLFALSTIALATISPAHAAECTADDKAPARYGKSSNALHKLLQFPRKTPAADFELALHCNYIVSKKGRLLEPGCDLPAKTPKGVKSAPFIKVFNKATRRAKIIPATVGGEPRRVLMQVTVVFRKKDGKSTSYILPNVGREAERFGAVYIAPQYVLGNDMDGGHDYSISHNYLPKLLTISADGAISDWREARGRRPERSKAEDFGRWSRRACFIPGYADGKAQQMQFRVLSIPKSVRWKF